MAGFYQGSRLLHPLSKSLGIPVDQVNFMVGELLAFILAIFFRVYLHPKTVGVNTRHLFASITGLLLGFFCYGRGFLHYLLQALVCYVIMLLAPPRFKHVLVLIVAMLYLSCMHIYRMIHDYGGYVLDVTGPMMISTQKLTSLAFSLHDGLHKKRENLTKDQSHHATNETPSPLHFSSYILYFQGLLCGPLSFYADYVKFVEGTQYRVPIPVARTCGCDENNQEEDEREETIPETDPSPMWVVSWKAVLGILWLCVALGITPLWEAVVNADETFISSHGFLFRLGFLMVSVPLSRARYYFAWKVGESISNASGLGFSGYDVHGNAQWDLITNARIRKVEGATSLKVLLDNWNIQTTLWLRRVFYDRAPKSIRTTLTYFISALWHGFYPGYMFTFLGGALFTSAARLVRKTIRPHFQDSRPARLFYDAITWFITQLSLNYLVVPFCVLEFWPTIYFYTNSMYWFFHIIVVLTLIFLPFLAPRLRRPAP